MKQLFIFVAFFLFVPGVFADSQSKPNIVMILADDLGFADVGFNGSKDIKTPNIDSLAASGVRFTSFYAQPMCTPTRAAFLTGRYPIRYGLQSFVITPGQHYGLPVDERTIAQALKEVGYKTYALGKWHLGHSDKAYWPQNRGFDYFYGSTIGNVDYFTKERAGVIDWQRNGKQLKEEGYFTDLITKDVVRIIEQSSDNQPFFIYMAHLAVHSPYQAPQNYIDQYQHIPDEHRRIYAAMTAAMDDSVGEVVAALDRKGLRDNTLVLFLSDNGGIAEFDATLAKARGEKPSPANNSPFRGSKASLYEGAVRSASAINWPGRIKPGVVSESVHVVDLLPTLVGLAGGEIQTDKPIDGKDIWPVITQGKVSPHQNILINAELHRGAVLQGKWKLIKYATLPSSVELYDLADDPAEKNNVAEQHSEKVQELEMILNEYAEQATGSLYLKEYMPFIIYDTKNAQMVYDGDEDSGQPDEKPNLPNQD
ncbi:MAG: sulfatase [Gammaproteobacteria bacterium]|nr:MAG: sulfatase [Gammaproteobacteria bacterium]